MWKPGRIAIISLAAFAGFLPEASCFSHVPVIGSPARKHVGFSPLRHSSPIKSPQLLPSPSQRSTAAKTNLNLSIETIFQIDNFLALPFWALMLLVPKSRVTRQVMTSYLPLLPLIFMYSKLPYPRNASPSGKNKKETCKSYDAHVHAQEMY